MRNTVAKSHPYFLVAQPVPTNEGMTTESQRYNCFIRNGGNAIPQHACPEAKGSSPTAELALLWDPNQLRGNSNNWQVSQEEDGRIILKRRHGNVNEFLRFLIL
jgi:hypothetical protein